MHELGHALGLDHHSNEEDLMGPTVGYEGGGPSACDLDGFEKAHEWLTADLGANGAYRTDATSIECEGESPQEDEADMSIEKAADPDPATAGEELTYTVTATNEGPDTASGVQVEDTLPAEVSFESVSATQGTCTGESTVTCDVGSLATDESTQITIKVTSTAEAAEAGEVTNTAAVESETPDPGETNNQAQVTTSVEDGGEDTPLEPECDAAWCPIQPGALLGDAEAGFCTMGFLFRDRDSGRLLVSTAAHCTESVGEELHAEAEEESFDMQEDAFGTVMFREDDRDFALIEVDEGREAETSASVRHWTGPDGVARSGETSVGDQVMYYGYGVAFDLTPELRPRQGVLTQHTDEEYQSNTAGMQGDSGAAVLHEDGGALGLISRFNVVEDGVSTDLGPTVEGMLSLLEASGRDVALVDADHSPPPLLPF